MKLLQVRKRLYDLREAAARAAWRDGAEGGDLLELPAVRAADGVAFALTGMADSLLVRAAAVEYRGGGRRSVTPNLEEGGAPVLPAASIKGAVRARAEMIARAAKLPDRCMDALFGRGPQSGENSHDRDAGVAGSVRFEDARFFRTEKAGDQPHTHRPLYRRRHPRRTVHRRTPVRRGLPARGRAREPLGCALLLYALRDLGLGLYNLGSGGAIGRGCLRVKRLEARHADGRTASLRFAGAGCEASDPDGLFAEWMRAWKEAMR